MLTSSLALSFAVNAAKRRLEKNIWGKRSSKERKRKIGKGEGKERGGVRKGGGLKATGRGNVPRQNSQVVTFNLRSDTSGLGRRPGGRGQKTALFVAKQKDWSWSDDYSPFTRPAGIKGRQGTFEAKRERGRREKKDRYPGE